MAQGAIRPEMDEIDVKPGQRVRAVQGAAAERLADLTGVQRDLESVAQCCQVITVREGAPGAEHIRRACFDSAVLRYRRCFNSGVRELIANSVFEVLTLEEKDLHRQILYLADKAIAHCVDGSEENFTYLRAGPVEGESVPLKVAVWTANILHHNKIEVAAFEALSRKIRALVREECDVLADKIIEDVRHMSLDDFLALPAVQRTIKDGNETISPRYASRKRKTKK